MTSLIAWVGVDTHGPASVYLASDSRISWSQTESWDVGRKLFASRAWPDLYGYCGDVDFPSLFLSQHIDLLDSGALVPLGAPAHKRYEVLEGDLRRCFDALPAPHQRPFTIMYCARTGEGMEGFFSIWRTDWSPAKGWRALELSLPVRSGTVAVLGSGEYAIMEQALAWNASAAGGTSRAVFSAFCDALRLGRDPHSGGAPQLVGLYRRGAGITFGIVWDGGRHLLGRAMGRQSAPNTVEWRNALLERCDGVTGERLPDAQPHLRPLMMPGI